MILYWLCSSSIIVLAIASSRVDEANHVIFLIQYQLASNIFQSIDYIYICILATIGLCLHIMHAKS